jgi:hypothetical protein
MNKKNIILFGMIFLIGILLINFASAESSYCCERLKSGAWCQSALQNECATGTSPLGGTYKSVATSCEMTSYCQLGTCINSVQGSCMPNTPQVVCNNNGGNWKGEKIEDLPECQLGCCLLGNQAAFVTQTECKKLSSEYGLKTNYRPDITTELECIASITSDVMGACVFEKEYEKTCLMLSQKECSEIEASSQQGMEGESVAFHEGFLCSAPELATNCGPRGGTVCKDEQVYFLDTCGNIANIYDYSKLNDTNNYWTYIQEPSCDNGAGNKNSLTCGACDYFSGSVCKSYQRGKTIKPTYGNSFCGSLDCTYNGKPYLHGETWCVENSLSNVKGKNLPGSRYFRFMCYNGEVTPEPCSEFRNEICIESEVNDYSVAGCVINRWQDCINQTNKGDCEDVYARECKWISGLSILKDENGNNLGITSEADKTPGTCVPKYAPGFDFWFGEGGGPEWCSIASQTCVVKYEIGILSSKKKLEKADWDDRISKCVENCYCIPGYKNGAAKAKYENNKPSWHPKSYAIWNATINSICTAMGDCGNKNNYLGVSGDVKEIFTSEFIKKP